MTVQSNNKSTKKIGEKSVLLAVIALIESLLLLVSFSFAWFEGGTALNLLGRNIKTDGVIYSTIQVGEGSDYQKVISLNDYFSAQNKAKFTPVSSVDGKTFYTMYQGNVSDLHTDSSLVKWRKLTPEDVNSSILRFQFQVKSPTADCYFWFKELPKIAVNGVEDSDLSKAFRIHFDDGRNSVTSTVADSWYNNYSGTAVKDLNANDGANIADSASMQFAKGLLYSDSTYNTKYLFHCAKGKTVTVTCSVWLEATDPLAVQIAPGSNISFDVQISSSFSQMTEIQVSAANIAKPPIDTDNIVPIDTEFVPNENSGLELPEESDIEETEAETSAPDISEEAEPSEGPDVEETTKDVAEETGAETSAPDISEETDRVEEPVEEESTKDATEESDAETTVPETFEDTVITDPSFTEEETPSEDIYTESDEELSEGVGNLQTFFTNSNANGEKMVLELYNADTPKRVGRCVYTAEYNLEENCWIARVPVALQNIKLVYHKVGDSTKVEGEWLATERGTNNVYTLIDNDTGAWGLPSEIDLETEVKDSADVGDQTTEGEPLGSVTGESSDVIIEDVSKEPSNDDISDDTAAEDSNAESSVETELSDESELFEETSGQETLEEPEESSEQLPESSQSVKDASDDETSEAFENSVIS